MGQYMIIKIIIWVVGLLVLSRIIANYENKKISLGQLLLWSIIWLLVIAFTTWPYITDQLAHAVGVKSGTDIALFIAVILLFYLMFRVYVKLIDVESNITEIVKGIAVKNIVKGKDKKTRNKS
jgi:hypothetical protein